MNLRKKIPQETRRHLATLLDHFFLVQVVVVRAHSVAALQFEPLEIRVNQGTRQRRYEGQSKVRF